MLADLYFLSSMSCALINHWVRLHSIVMDLFDQADGLNGAHTVSIVMCLGKVETAPTFAECCNLGEVRCSHRCEAQAPRQGRVHCRGPWQTKQYIGTKSPVDLIRAIFRCFRFICRLIDPNQRSDPCSRCCETSMDVIWSRPSPP